jgi:hypothetical protein
MRIAHRVSPPTPVAGKRLIGALFEFLTRIEVSWLAQVLTLQPPSALCVPVYVVKSKYAGKER